MWRRKSKSSSSSTTKCIWTVSRAFTPCKVPLAVNMAWKFPLAVLMGASGSKLQVENSAPSKLLTEDPLAANTWWKFFLTCSNLMMEIPPAPSWPLDSKVLFPSVWPIGNESPANHSNATRVLIQAHPKPGFFLEKMSLTFTLTCSFSFFSCDFVSRQNLQQLMLTH